MIDSTYCEKRGKYCPESADPSYKTKCCLQNSGGIRIITCCNPIVGLVEWPIPRGPKRFDLCVRDFKISRDFYIRNQRLVACVCELTKIKGFLLGFLTELYEILSAFRTPRPIHAQLDSVSLLVEYT